MLSYDEKIIRYAMSVHNLPSLEELINLNSFKIQNPLCGDELTWYYQVEKEKIRELHYSVSACLICKAATHLCYTQFKDASLKQLKLFIKKYTMLSDKPQFRDELECFSELQFNLNRQKCVTLPYKGLNQALLKKINT